jgi:2-oxoisovalerate dehydrogenase E1 component
LTRGADDETRTRSHGPDWEHVARLVILNREIDRVEREQHGVRQSSLYQFSAAGHDVAQVLLGLTLTHQGDGVSVYYRSRPLMLALGFTAEDALAASLGRADGLSGGRDVGVVYNMPSMAARPTVLPMAGDVGSQYAPALGWAEALSYGAHVLGRAELRGAIAVAHGGDGSVAGGGFWSALLAATTRKLPALFYVEDNGLSISVPGDVQVPEGNIVTNLRAMVGLSCFDGDGGDPEEAARLIRQAVDATRTGKGPSLLRLSVPRLEGHSARDAQPYLTQEQIAATRARDPLPRLRALLVPSRLSNADWERLESEVRALVQDGFRRACARLDPSPDTVTHFVFGDREEVAHRPPLQPAVTVTRTLDEGRTNEEDGAGHVITLREALRSTLAQELRLNPRVVVFGQDVGRMGGVFSVTRGLQAAFGPERVFDTNLSEEGIVGRAIGMALAGLMPVAEIQFRKYADAAVVQLHNCGTIRWRTNGRFQAPLVVRIPVGYSKINDPWHSESNEAEWIHAVGLRVAYPSNAEDAAGLLRNALRGPDPTLFLEHRALLASSKASRPLPPGDFVLPFGVARTVLAGSEITVVTWGAMVERCVAAAAQSGASVDLIDLRTQQPWDSERVLASVTRTGRCIVVHEDRLHGGFGAEIVAAVTARAFYHLRAPPTRLAMQHVPMPFNDGLAAQILPDSDRIATHIMDLISQR